MSVVDASIIVRLLLNRATDTSLRERFRKEDRLHVPTLIDAEVASAVRGFLLTSKSNVRLSPTRAQQMIDDYAELPFTRYPMQPMHQRVLELRANFTAYDAFYVVLAEALDMPLLTDDAKFARAPGLPIIVETWPT